MVYQRVCLVFVVGAPGNAASVVVEAAVPTVDHSDIRGSTPHNHDPSGAASDYGRGSSPQARRIMSSRILHSRVPLDYTDAASRDPGAQARLTTQRLAADGVHAQAPHHPQCHDADERGLAGHSRIPIHRTCLTSKTVPLNE